MTMHSFKKLGKPLVITFFAVAAALFALTEARANNDIIQVIDYSFASVTGMASLDDQAVVLVRNGDSRSDQIWMTDGTAAGTTPIADINVGAGTQMFDAGSHIFIATRFLPSPLVAGQPQLWVTDGTVAGTTLIGDDESGPIQTGKRVAREGTLFFTRFGALWRADANTGMQTQVKGSDADSFNYLAFVGDQLLVSADSSGARELWRSDGTESGTVAVARIESGCTSPLTTVSDLLYFLCGRQLWLSDGTEAGTQLVTVMADGLVDAQPVGATDDRFFFRVSDAGTQVLWVSDGTAAGTQAIADLKSDTEAVTSQALAGELIVAIAATTSASELWRIDGTAAGTKKIGEFPWINTFEGFTPYQGQLYFSAAGMVTGTELWVTDGSMSGTRQLTDAVPGIGPLNPTSLAVVGDHLVFSPRTIEQYTLWRSDGTAAGTARYKAIYTEGAGIEPTELTPVGDRLYFNGACNLPFVLNETHGTPDTLGLLDCGRFDRHEFDFRPVGSVGLVEHQDALYFSAVRTFSFGPEINLWRADASGAREVRNRSATGNLTSISDALFMNERRGIFGTGAPGNEPAVIDAEGFRQLASINCTGDSRGSNAGGFTALNDTEVLFAATQYARLSDDGTCLPQDGRGRELWRTDGTEAGTMILKDINEGTPSSSPTNFIRLGGRMLFTADDGINGTAVWQSDGTEAGTVMMIDINPAGDTVFGEFIRFGNDIVFAADPGTGSMQLWRSDGSAAGTRPITLGEPANPDSFAVFGNRLYFGAEDAAGDRELWSSDGTPAGTQRVLDIHPGTNSSNPEQLTSLNSALVFTADDGNHGMELWSSDGTPVGTRLVNDLRTGVDGSQPSELTILGDTLFMSADDGITGRELWRYTPIPDSGNAVTISMNATPAVFTQTGDQIAVDYTVNNASNTQITNVRGTDSQLGDVCTIGSLWLGISTTCTSIYFVTDDDVSAGAIQFNATLVADGVTAISDSVSVTGTAAPLFDVSAVSSSGTFAALFEPLVLTVIVKNVHIQMLTNLTITEPRIGQICASESLWPGVSVTCTAVHFVDASDVAAGEIRFNFAVTHDQSAGVSNQSLTVPGPTPGNQLSLTAEAVPQSFNGAGEQLTINIAVANNRDTEQTNIQVTSAKLGVPLCQMTSLWPTFEGICTGVYRVTEADASSGVINFDIITQSDQMSDPKTFSLSVPIAAN